MLAAVLGGLLSALSSDSLGTSQGVSVASAICGGILLLLGARLGAGCTRLQAWPSLKMNYSDFGSNVMSGSRSIVLTRETGFLLKQAKISLPCIDGDLAGRWTDEGDVSFKSSICFVVVAVIVVNLKFIGNMVFSHSRARNYLV